jgi:hypothetical protein
MFITARSQFRGPVQHFVTNYGEEFLPRRLTQKMEDKERVTCPKSFHSAVWVPLHNSADNAELVIRCNATAHSFCM